MTVRRYHPHAQQKLLRNLPRAGFPDCGSLASETLERARFWWEDPAAATVPGQALSSFIGWPSEDSPYLQAPEGGLAEFGLDATRLAGLTAPEGKVPDLVLLASSWRWLAGFHEVFAGWREAPYQAWDPQPWIRAGAAARDHLLHRSKVYPGLAALRKAWKEAPITPATPAAGKRLALLLLAPFAPVMARALSQPPSTSEQPFLDCARRGLGEPMLAFPPLAPVCISLARGGRRWEALDPRKLAFSPRDCLAELPFLAATLRGCRWEARPVPEGWVIELGAKAA